MKCAAIFLFACVAVSHAAFTANLVQRAQPALSQALFKVRLASRASEIQTPLVQQLEQQANQLLEQIENAVTTGQQIASSVVSQLQDTYNQLASLGSSVVANGQSILSNLFGNIWGSLFGHGKSLSGVVNFVQNFDLNAAIQSLLAYAQNLVNQLNLPQLLQNAASALFAQLQGRGVFSDIWNQVQAAGQQAWAAIQSVISNVTTVAGNAFNQVQALAQSFVSEATTEITTITSQAASDFLNFLKPYQQDLGALYDQVAAQVTSIIGKN
jgi:phage-related protein